jgi:hypothetical protein
MIYNTQDDQIKRDMDQIITQTLTGLAQQGLGWSLFILALWYIGRQQQELKDLRDAHKQELAAKDKTILELQEARVIEAKSGFQIASATQTTLQMLFKQLTGDSK